MNNLESYLPLFNKCSRKKVNQDQKLVSNKKKNNILSQDKIKMIANCMFSDLLSKWSKKDGFVDQKNELEISLLPARVSSDKHSCVNNS